MLVWAPLNGGWLTGKYQAGAQDATSRAIRQPEHFDHRDAKARDAKLAIVGELQQIAATAGISLVQLALGFVLRDPVVACALIGPRTLPQLEQLLAAGHVELSADVLAAIDGVVAPGVDVNPNDGL
jgi:aryl-alcohol dehydrogenase-like predicted oxidoreductase